MNASTQIVPPEFDKPSGKSVGLIVMSSDEVGEHAFKSLMPEGVRVFTTRAAYDEEQYLAGEFVPIGGFESLAQCLPAELDLVAFSCTSAAISKGIGTVSAEIDAAFPGIPSTNPALALREMLRLKEAKNIGFLSPYPVSMQKFFLNFFEENQVNVLVDATFAIESDPDYKRLSKQSFYAAIDSLNSRASNLDFNFISCTALDVVRYLPYLNRGGTPPVYSSSQLFAAHALQCLGLLAQSESALARSRPEATGLISPELGAEARG